MSRATHIPVSFAVEGDTDEAAVRRMATHLGIVVHEVFVRNGKANVLKALPGLNGSAQAQPWFVLVDLNGDTRCVPEAVRAHLPNPASQMRFRIAVRALESWILADKRGFARFFGVPTARVPNAPEAELDPKTSVIELARLSKKNIVRKGMPPRNGSGRRTGELYASLLIEFATTHWDLESARKVAPSLDRAMQRLNELAVPC